MVILTRRLLVLAILLVQSEASSSPLGSSTCELTSLDTSQFALNDVRPARVDCVIRNSGGADQRNFTIVLESYQTDIPASRLAGDGCGGSSLCIKPILALGSTVVVSPPSVIHHTPPSHSGRPSQISAQFRGVVRPGEDLDVAIETEVYVPHLYTLNADFTLTVSVTDESSEPATNQIGQTIVTSSFSGMRVDAVSERERTLYLPIGEVNYFRFSLLGSDPTGVVYSGLSLVIYSNSLLNVYQLTLDGADLLPSIVTSDDPECATCGYQPATSISAPVGQVNSDQDYAFRISFHLLETAGNPEEVFVHVMLIADSQLPWIAVERRYITFPVNPGVSILKEVSQVSDGSIPQIMQARITITNDSPLPLYSATLRENVESLRVIQNDNRVAPNGWTQEFNNLTASLGNLNPGESELVLSYDFTVQGDGSDFPEGEQWRGLEMTFIMVTGRSSYQGYPGPEFRITTPCPSCYSTTLSTRTHTEDRYEWIAVGIIIAFVVGFLLMTLVIILLLNIRGYAAIITINPLDDEETPEERERRLRKELRARKRKAAEKRRKDRLKKQQSPAKKAPENKSKIYFKDSGESFQWILSDIRGDGSSEEKSLVSIMGVEDAAWAEKLLTSAAIWASCESLEASERSRVNLMKSVVTGLLHQLGQSLDSGLAERLDATFRLDVEDLEAKEREEEKREIHHELKKLRLNHEKQLVALRIKQLDERKAKTAQLKCEPRIERHNFLTMLDKQHKLELEQLWHLLGLQRLDAIQAIKRTHNVNVRLGVKQTGVAVLLRSEDVTSRRVTPAGGEQEVASSRLDLLAAALARLDAATDAAHLAEVTRMGQERLALRKQFVAQRELVTEKQRQSLNTIADHIRRFLDSQYRLGRLTEEELADWMTRLRDDILSMKHALAAERNSRLNQLQGSMSEKRDQLMAQLETEYQKDLAQFDENKLPELRSGSISVERLLDERFQRVGQFTARRWEAEVKLDGESCEEVLAAMGKVFDDTYTALEHASSSYATEILKEEADAEADGSGLAGQLTRDRERTRLALAEELARLRAQGERRVNKLRKHAAVSTAQQQAEMADLRRHEDTLVRTLVEGQLVWTEDELERVRAEHRATLTGMHPPHMAADNLRTQLRLETALAARTQRKAARLAERHAQETEERERRKTYGAEEVKEMDFARQHLADRTSQLSIPKKKVTQLLHQIEADLVRERVQQLKQREEALATLMAAIQLGRFRAAAETAGLEEAKMKQLKLAVLGELATDEKRAPAIHKLLDKFNHERSELVTRLNEERKQRVDKAASDLEEKYTARKESNRKLCTTHFKNRQASETDGLILAAEFTDQLNQQELESLRMEQEKSQLLEGVKFSLNLEQTKTLQDQEERLIRDLISDDVPEAELFSCLMILFPERGAHQLREVLSRVKPSDDQNTDLFPQSGKVELAVKLSEFRTMAPEKVDNPNQRKWSTNTTEQIGRR